MTTNGHAAERGKKRVCLFGGTFDPVHLSHSHIAAAAVRALDLDKLIFLPCRQSPHKSGQDHAGADHRLAMCRIAADAVRTAEVDDHDISAPEPCYSWRTAEHMRARFPGARLFWLMGTDQWLALPRWNRAGHLASLVEFIVFTRGEEPAPREGFRLHSVRGDHPASATAIRQALRTGDTALARKWLDPGVYRYIRRHGLYPPEADS